MTFRILIALVGLGMAFSLPAKAGIQNPIVEGDELSADIELTPGLKAELVLRFEKSVGLSVDNLGLSASTIDITDLDILQRLPDPTAINLLSSFPVRVTVAPPADGGFAFEGVAEVELYTRNLQYTAATPFRIFAASPGEDFRDITASVSGGSYRTRGSTGNFSDFLIVADTRLLPDAINAKFDHLEASLNQFATEMDSVLFNELDVALQASRSAWAGGDAATALDYLQSFEALVEAASGTGLPNVWRSARDLDNVAGVLRAEAQTLRFSLTQAINFS
ncbi:DUF6689 family protein [Gammaproteobacteria bacterium AB-CW1]|uniref:DUF6689 family protein n=1 Tax=Natronospira elongata TaxID=3110268 RepID=A0AAP6JDB5_9GAMM|nr:DUF6689 family protein [Gammaproteobacteria bacterium AB-CW1]